MLIQMELTVIAGDHESYNISVDKSRNSKLVRSSDIATQTKI
jgi:hypothetical protein